MDTSECNVNTGCNRDPKLCIECIFKNKEKRKYNFINTKCIECTYINKNGVCSLVTPCFKNEYFTETKDTTPDYFSIRHGGYIIPNYQMMFFNDTQYFGNKTNDNCKYCNLKTILGCTSHKECKNNSRFESTKYKYFYCKDCITSNKELCEKCKDKEYFATSFDKNCSSCKNRFVIGVCNKCFDKKEYYNPLHEEQINDLKYKEEERLLRVKKELKKLDEDIIKLKENLDNLRKETKLNDNISLMDNEIRIKSFNPKMIFVASEYDKKGNVIKQTFKIE